MMPFSSYFFVVLITVIAAQKNLAPNGTTTQSSIDFNCGARSAVTGYASHDWIQQLCTCTHTYNSKTGWWRDDFHTYVYVTNLTMYYREGYEKDLRGFKFYVTNSTSYDSAVPNENDLCYEDPNTVSTNVYQEIHCNTIGKSVFFYIDRYPVNRAFVLICYLEINGCWKSFWGPECSTPCPANCINQHCYPGNGTCVWGCDSTNCLNDTCDQYTSVCTQGCKTGKMGRYCNIDNVNLALNGTATQDPFGNSPAKFAIDGIRTLGNCAITEGPTTWLQIDLGGLSIIEIVSLTFSENPSEGENHTIYATNTSSAWKDSTILYRGEKIPNNDIHLAVVSICRYVIYRAPIIHGVSNLNLCEIEIGGCPVGRYQSSCSMKCPANCGGTCDIDTGICIFGCMDGWLGDECDQACESGFYGNKCKKRCSPNCLSTPCHHVTGECLNGGCKKGWEGKYCNTECDYGFYGYNCSNTCSPGCVSYKCDRFEGTCSITNPQQCNPGWKYDPLCYEPCNDGNYGHNCSEICNCSVPCNKDTGSCSADCEAGWQGTKCSKECSHGYFGINCESQCGACPCDRFNGDCTGGCEDSYTGHLCKKIGYSIGVVIGSSIGCAVISVVLTLAVVFCTIKARMNKGSDQSQKGLNTAIGIKTSMEESKSEQNYDLCGMHNNASYEDYKSRDDQHVYDEMPAVSSDPK